MSAALPTALKDSAATAGPSVADGRIREAFGLSLQGHLPEARAILTGMLREDPRNLDALNLAGVVEGQAGNYALSLQRFNEAIALRDDFADARCNRAFLWLLQGDFERGWPEYEWRWKLAARGTRQPAANSLPMRWLGKEPLQGKSILLRAEQGLGDCLQYCRYVTALANQGAKVILEAPAPLVGLLAELEGLWQIVTVAGALPGTDFWCPLMSLPLALKTALDTIPSPAGYLRSDPMKVAAWRRRLGESKRPRIGLAWSGSPANQNDFNRTVPLKEMLQHLPGQCDYVSLQKTLRADDARTLDETKRLQHFGDELHDFTDTAALCQCMDLVISVDTSVLHASAALGKRTWVMLPFRPTWRWLLDRTDSPWYSSITLYRQSAPAQWSDVLERIASDLSRLSASSFDQ